MAQLSVDEAGCSIDVLVPARECPAASVRFTAYLFMDRADPLLEPAADGLRVSLRWRARLSGAGLEEEGRLFLEELEAQRFQGEILERNRSIHEHIIRLALTAPAESAGEPALSDLNLSEAEERELDKLIAEVETLIAEDRTAAPEAAQEPDPLGIRATWEETHGDG